MEFYNSNKKRLIRKYLKDFPLRIDPDVVRELFIPIGYDRSNVPLFQDICKELTKDIFFTALKKNKGKINKVIFAAGLPGTGKSSHMVNFGKGELIYDGTLNDDKKLIKYIQAALDMGFLVEIYIYLADPIRAFKTNLARGDTDTNNLGRYAPISQYEKVAATINRREKLIKDNFNELVEIYYFEHTDFKGILTQFSQIIINRNELENIARKHTFRENESLDQIIK